MAPTAEAHPRRAVADAPTYRAYPVTVERTRRLGPHFVRLTFAGPELASFGYAGHDQRVKILLPRPGRTLADLPTGSDWHARWRELPDDVRPTMRTYTVRAFRPAQRELDVDVVLHGLDGEGAGPVSRWASIVGAGDKIAVVGPDRPGNGRLWGVEWRPPPRARAALIAGDETAVPAIAAILESLGEDIRVLACAEIPVSADIPDNLHVPANAEMRWLPRRGPDDPADVVGRGTMLEAAVTDAMTAFAGRPASPTPVADLPDDLEGRLLWDVPEIAPATGGEVYVWMAGEAGVMRRLRRAARFEFGLPRSSVACMGYWRRGTAEPG